MFGRLGKLLLVALITEAGGAIIQAGKGWLDRKLAGKEVATEAAARAEADIAETARLEEASAAITGIEKGA